MKLFPPIYTTEIGVPHDFATLIADESQGFGANPTYYGDPKIWLHPTLGHTGLDFPCAVGTPVYASHDGTVISVSTDINRGEGVLIHGEDGDTLYWHLSQPQVQLGQTVTRGQQIGLSGNTGQSSGPHLHFEYRPHDVPTTNGYNGAVDPTPSMEWAWLPSSTIVMTQEEVDGLYVALGAGDPDGSGHKDWVGKPLIEFLKAYIPNRIKELNSVTL